MSVDRSSADEEVVGIVTMVVVLGSRHTPIQQLENFVRALVSWKHSSNNRLIMLHERTSGLDP